MVCKICMKKKLYKDLPYARNSVSKCQAQKALNKSLQLFPLCSSLSVRLPQWFSRDRHFQNTVTCVCTTEGVKTRC